MDGDLLVWTVCVSLDVDRRRRNCVIRTVIVVVVAIVVVAVPVVVNAVHDDHPFRFNPFPRAERADTPQRNGRSCAVARMTRDVSVADTRRRRMVAWRRMGVPMPYDGRLVGRTGRCGMMCRAGPGSRPCGMRSRRPCLLGRPWWVSVAAMVATGGTTPWRSACYCAECRAGDSDECEFHDVVVHNAPSLSVLRFDGEPISPLHPARQRGYQFLTNPFGKNLQHDLQRPERANALP